ILRDLGRGDRAKGGGDTGYRNEDWRVSAADSRLDTEHCQLLTELRWILQKTCFVFADAMAIPTAISRVNEIYGTIESLDDSPENCELKSIALAAKLILEGHHEDTI
ncbi:MAG: hypothetical protein FWG82_03715, partial [Oscillospiraceae bacterium]|nr:hypothetical protein [Oscillospiraceae bacterium]